MRPEARATDWDAYYRRPYRLAALSRRYTGRTLVRLLREFAPAHPRILELGGANSCFIERILEQIAPARYDVLDSNELGLDLLEARYSRDSRVSTIRQDVLSFDWQGAPYDVVLSVGLIEHFGRGDTARAIAAHFSAIAPGGVAVVTFPTPTLLYRFARAVSEATGQWIFHDERPLRLEEFQQTAGRFGTVKRARILWPLVLTQYCVVTEKR